MSQEVERWADGAMYPAAPLAKGIEVQLVSATQDPLGVIAAASMMYEGKPIGDLREITDEQRLHYFEEMGKTKLTAPLEFVDLHFLISGVTRAFTHQMVRQRTAVYAQESLRFAVKKNFARETPLPPSLALLKDDDPRRVVWEEHMRETQVAYEGLIAAGIPAEDARGLLPHQTTTRLHYKTNLRNLVDHVGNRLCTQAQFEWRRVIFEMMEAMRTYVSATVDEYSVEIQGGNRHYTGLVHVTKWQWAQIIDPKHGFFVPACYQAGHCPFKADFDRGCTIRERADKGRFDLIEVKEWAADPTAAYLPTKESK